MPGGGRQWHWCAAAGPLALASAPALLDTLAISGPHGGFVMPQSSLPLSPTPGRSIDSFAQLPAGSATRVVQLVLLLALPSLAQAQEVFVTRGAGGTVYSDKPQPGAKAVNLPPITVVEPVPVAKDSAAAARKPQESSRPVAAGPVYRSFSIVSPEDNGSVAANAAPFEVRVAVDPPLQLGDGHAIMVRVNGQPVGQRFTASEFTIPPEFWGDTLPPANQRYQLDAAIVDRGGEVLRNAPPVSFILRYVAGAFRPPWYGSEHRPRPTPLPGDKPKPPPAPPFDPWEKKFEQQGLRFYQR